MSIWMSKIRGLAEVLVKIDERLQIQRVGAMIQPLPNRDFNRHSCAARGRPFASELAHDHTHHKT